MNEPYINVLINNKDWGSAMKLAGSIMVFVSAYILNNDYTYFNDMITYFLMSHSDTYYINTIIKNFKKKNIDKKYIDTSTLFIQLYRVLSIKINYNKSKSKNKKIVIPASLIKSIVECRNSAILVDIVNLYGDNLDRTYTYSTISDELAQELKDIGFEPVYKNNRGSPNIKIISKLVKSNKYKRQKYITNNCKIYGGLRIESKKIKNYTKVNKFFDEYVETIKNKNDLLKELYSIVIKHSAIFIFNKIIGYVPIIPSDINMCIRRVIKTSRQYKKMYSFITSKDIFCEIHTLITFLHTHNIEYNKDTMRKLVHCAGMTINNSASLLGELYLLLDMRKLYGWDSWHVLCDLIRDNNIEMIKKLIDNKIIMIQLLHKYTDFMQNAITNQSVDVVNYFHSLRIRCHNNICENLYSWRACSNKQSLNKLKLVESIGFPIDKSTLHQLCKHTHTFTGCIDYIINKYNLSPSSGYMSYLINNTKNYSKYKKYVNDINTKSYPIKMINIYKKSNLTYDILYLKLIIKLSKINNTDTYVMMSKMIQSDNIYGIVELIKTPGNYNKIEIMQYLIKKNYKDFFNTRYTMSIIYILCSIIADKWSSNVKKYFTDNHNIIYEYIANFHTVWDESLYEIHESWDESFSKTTNADELILPNNMAKIRILNIIKKLSDKNGKSVNIHHLIFEVFNTEPFHSLIGIQYTKTMREIISNNNYYKLVDNEINNINNISIKTEYINNTMQNDPIFILYKFYTDVAYIKYKQIAFNILIYILVKYGTRQCSIWWIKSIINEINNLYNIGAIPSPYTWVIATLHYYPRIHRVIIDFLRNLLTIHNKVFSRPLKMSSLPHNNIPTELVEYNHPPGFFDENEINMYIYNSISWCLPNQIEEYTDESTEELADELDILADNVKDDIVTIH